jgi:glycosyltransferase involved in cell wall biosynthesis
VSAEPNILVERTSGLCYGGLASSNMKVLFNCHVPFMLAHGGAQVQIEQSKLALERIGVETGFLQWWNEAQDGDILHHFGALSAPLIQLAKSKGWKVVVTILLTHTCNRSKRGLLLRKGCIRPLLLGVVPQRLRLRLPWFAFRLCDRVVVGLEAERYVLGKVYGVETKLITIVPYGLTEAFLCAGPGNRTENHLICHGRIDPVKGSLELAQLAREAQVPVLFVGKPHDTKSEYWQRFSRLVDNEFVKHHSHVESEAGLVNLLQRARGFVSLSRFENWCLAAHEAAACGLPVLLSDVRWARERFGNQAAYFPAQGKPAAVAALRRFYEQGPSLPTPKVWLPSWGDVAVMLRDLYTQLLVPQTKVP